MLFNDFKLKADLLIFLPCIANNVLQEKYFIKSLYITDYNNDNSSVQKLNVDKFCSLTGIFLSES